MACFQQLPRLWHTSWIMAVWKTQTQMAIILYFPNNQPRNRRQEEQNSWYRANHRKYSTKNKSVKKFQLFHSACLCPSCSEKQRRALTKWKFHTGSDLCDYINHVVVCLLSSICFNSLFPPSPGGVKSGSLAPGRVVWEECWCEVRPVLLLLSYWFS